VELGEADVCCGSAGSYNLTEAAMARRLRERKIDHIAATGASCVVVGNPGCALQIRAGLMARGLDVRVAHPVELLDEASA
jgi:glycolate oxidase iron-sulfur subunit